MLPPNLVTLLPLHVDVVVVVEKSIAELLELPPQTRGVCGVKSGAWCGTSASPTPAHESSAEARSMSGGAGSKGRG